MNRSSPVRATRSVLQLSGQTVITESRTEGGGRSLVVHCESTDGRTATFQWSSGPSHRDVTDAGGLVKD
ncbi:MAG TPA: hypothetical protein VNY31_04685 [Solirubrobacteraceae bacterium]|nr:hypothetical protein [Solirubrobacteraceae bacterium]